MATAAQFQSVIDKLSADQMMQLKGRLTNQQVVQMTIPLLLSTTQLNELCAAIAEAYPPIAADINAII